MRPGRTRHRRAKPWRSLIVAFAVVLTACGGTPAPPIGAPEDVAGEELAEICELLAEGVPPEGMDQDAYDELLAGYRILCDQVGAPLPPGATPGGPDVPSDDGVAADGGSGEYADGDAARNGAADVDDQGWADADPADEELRRRAIAAGPQCDPATLDLSMSEVAKAPAIGPVGSPPFDAELAKEQYRAPGQCLPEPYRSQWFLVADAYDPVFDLLEAYAAASNQGFEALVELGEQMGEYEARLARLHSDDVQAAIASTQAFFAELQQTGAWDEHEADSPWGRWWDAPEFRDFWSRAQDFGAWSGVPVPDLPDEP